MVLHGLGRLRHPLNVAHVYEPLFVSLAHSPEQHAIGEARTSGDDVVDRGVFA